MKILRIIASANPSHGGPIEGALRVGAELAKMGHVQDIATLDAPDAPYLKDAPARIIPLGHISTGPVGRRMPLRQRFGYSSQMVPWLRAHAPDYDAVIVSGLWNYVAIAARRALIGGPTPYVVFAHGMLDPWFKENYRMKAAAKQAAWLINEGPLLAHAHRVLFTSEEEMRRAEGVFKPYRVSGQVVAYGTVDMAGTDAIGQIAAFRSQLPALSDRHFLLFLSRIHEKKGCDLLVEAFAEAAARMPEVDLVIAGPDEVGLKEKLTALAERHGVGARIHWPGMLRGDAKWGAFRAADAFVLPSHQENFGIVAAEALGCGQPVLISDRVNIWREVLAGGAGLVAPDTLEGTRSLFDRLLAMTAEDRAAMGARARATYLQHFGIQNAARDLVAVLEEAACRKAAA